MVAQAWEGEEVELQPSQLRIIVEAQRGRAFLWAPVAFAMGVWVYFGLSQEPAIGMSAAIAAAAAILFAWRHHGIVLLVSVLLAGFAVAKLRTETAGTPLLHVTTTEVAIVAQVIGVSARGKRRELVVAPTGIAGVDPIELPRRLRLSAQERHGAPRPGDVINAKVRLQPVPGPIIPGGFDFGRQLFFEGIGGTGRVTAPISFAEAPLPWTLWLNRKLQDVRTTINARITAVLEGDTAAIAEALIDGERGTISRQLNTSFQASGLAHVLSISGLHMSLVAGGVFWLVRALLALVPALALRWPIKKFAAAAALVVGLFYMLLAGAEVATQRSYIMIAVVFFSVLVDRPALSLRNLAIAATLILLLQPEAAIQAGFQMSFLAVLGLAAFFEAWAQHRRARDEEHHERRTTFQRVVWKLAAAIAISLATTVVAGFMSSIPAAYHFGHIAPYGVIANGLAIPVISLVVMPMGLLAALLMPLGLEAWPLWAMGQGLDLTIAISNWVTTLPGAATILPQQAASAAMLSAMGAVALCLLNGKARYIGIVLLAAGALLGTRNTMPDILINRTASNIAVMNAAGELVPLSGRKDRFAVERWLTANGEEATAAEAAQRPAWTCTETRCTASINSATIVALTDEAKQPADCTGADIVIAAYPLRGNCKTSTTRIDRFSVWREGSHALWISNGKVSVITARSLQGDRPWVVRPRPRQKSAPPIPLR
jgi:competence protein ComEC